MSVQQRPRGRGRGQNGQPSRGHGDPSSNPYGTDKTEPRSRQISPHRSAQIVTPSVANQSRKSSKTRGLRSVRGAREAGQTAPSPLSKEVKFDSGEQSWRDPSIAGGTEYKDRMHDLWQSLKKNREKERKDAIKNGFLADPDKPTSLAHAITPVGTCQDMCPEFERVERIVQLMVDNCEKTAVESSDTRLPSEKLMVKRFRRSAAGYDEQLPSDIRPPLVLQKTLNYLFDELLAGSQRLASVHKFLWDRTRGIRNDFSIQQVTKTEDIRIAINCFERIARFHILSLHQLSHPSRDNGEFDQHQEREQLNNTLLSLMYYYDDSRHKLTSPNEAEFRAYCIIFEIRDLRPDIEDRAQNWPKQLLKDTRIQTAFRLYAAAGNVSETQGPLRPQTQFPIAQSNYALFWTILGSNAVSYLMACAAEIYFNLVRSRALEAIWRAYKRPGATKLEDWVLSDVVIALGLDNEEQAQRFCEDHGFTIGEREDGETFLDIGSVASNSLADLNDRRKQVFSKTLVERKRLGRTLSAVIDGMSVSKARAGGYIDESLVEEESKEDETLFLSDDSEEAVSTTEKKEKDLPPTENSAETVEPTIPEQASSRFNFATPPSSFGLPCSANPPTSASQPSSASLFSKLASNNSPFSATSTYPFGQATDSLTAGPFTNPLSTPTDVPRTTFTSLFPASKTPKFNFAATTSTGSGTPSPFAISTSANSETASKIVPAATQNPGLFDQTYASPSGLPSISGAPPIITLTNGGPGLNNSLPGTPTTTKQPTSQTSGQAHASLFQSVESSTARSNFQAFPQGETQNSKPPPPLFQTLSTPSNLYFPAVQSSPITRPTPATFVFPAETRPLQLPNQASSSEAIAPETIAREETAASRANFAPSIAAPELNKAQNASNLPALSDQQPSGPQPNHSPLRPQPPSLNSGDPFKGKIFPPSAPSGPSTSRSTFKTPRPDIRPKALDQLANDAVCENDGLLQQFIENAISPMIMKAISQVGRERVREEIASARRLLLSKKYFRKWRQNSWKRGLLRKGKERRKNFADSIQAMALSRSQSRDINHVSSEVSERGFPNTVRANNADMPPPPRPATSEMRGKRTSLPNDLDDRPISMRAPSPERKRHRENTTMSTATAQHRITKPHHKRSQTLDSPSSVMQHRRVPATKSTFSSRLSFWSNPSLINETVQKKARRLVPPGRTDTTHTDYFKLKAMGVNPDTPIIPTSRKRRISQGYDESSWRKSSRISPTDSSRPSSSQSMRPTETKVSAITRESDVASTANNHDDEELLAQVREIRTAMAESINWFREEREKSEKSPSSSATRDQRPETEKERRLREFQFTPSRTELRLRATGGHGLLPKNWGQRSGPLSREASIGSDQPTQASVSQDFGALRKQDSRTQTPLTQGYGVYGNGHESAQKEREVSGSGTGAHEDDAIELSD